MSKPLPIKPALLDAITGGKKTWVTLRSYVQMCAGNHKDP